VSIGRRIFLDRTDRLQRLAVPSQDLARIAERLRRRGVEIIDLSRVSAGRQISATGTDAAGWQPATTEQLAALREAAAHWYEHRFGVTLDPESEITFVPNAVIGMTLLSLSFVEAGDMALLPDPGAAFYRGAIVMAGGGVVPYHLSDASAYRPRFAALAERLVGRTRLIVLSYPHNPTAAQADATLFAEAVAFARKHQTLVVSDAAFAFPYDAQTRPPSFLSASYATGVGVEIAALDTNFGRPDLPLALVAGNREAVSAVAFLTEAGRWSLPQGMVNAACRLLLEGDAPIRARLERLAPSHRLLCEMMSELDWEPMAAATSPYLWVRVRARVGAEAFCRRLLRRTGVLVAPGTDFGEGGEGYIRVTIPEDPALAQKVVDRWRRHVRIYQRRLPRPRHIGARLRRHSDEK
jgi:LL-diaminopimelate aminotransferase